MNGNLLTKKISHLSPNRNLRNLLCCRLYSLQTEISETSYAVVFTFSLINISMPADSDVRGNTDQRLQDIINNAVKIYK